jgi:hypothetical protein
MQLLETALPEAEVLMPRRIGDVRGFFPRDGMRAILPAPASMPAFVQDNHVRNPLKVRDSFVAVMTL